MKRVTKRVARRLAHDQRGVVLLELLIAVVPVLVLFLGAVQLALLGAAQLVVHHAAITGARSAAVVLDDDPARYGDDPPGSLTGARLLAIRRAVTAPLTALPWAAADDATVSFPITQGADQLATDRVEDLEWVSVRVEHRVRCDVPIARAIMCPSITLPDGTTQVRARRLAAEATLPRFAASYPFAGESSGGAP
jgi:hypothetical protein